MISEILTGVLAAATGGYLWTRARHQRESEKIRNRLKALAGIIPPDRVTVSSQTKNNNSDEPYWWQKNEYKKLLNQSKFPETKTELDKYLEMQKQELKVEAVEKKASVTTISKEALDGQNANKERH